MNILFFVMTMLMLLALMTYGRLESFRSFAFVQAQFKEYMENKERAYVTEEARKRYQSEKGSTKDDDDDKAERNSASSQLSFNLFVDKEERDKHSAELETHKIIAKNLIYFLYGEHPFFAKMEEKRPGFVDEILSALVQVTEEYLPTQKLNSRKVKEIATVDFGNPDLNEAFTKMLKGSTENIEPSAQDEENRATADSDHPFLPEKGYYSLLDFITLEKNKLKIRVFLASPQLLMALFGNKTTVKNILETRYTLYRQLVNEEITPEAGKIEFQGQFQNQQLPQIPLEMLDFGISKTNPNRYI